MTQFEKFKSQAPSASSMMKRVVLGILALCSGCRTCPTPTNTYTAGLLQTTQLLRLPFFPLTIWVALVFKAQVKF